MYSFNRIPYHFERHLNNIKLTALHWNTPKQKDLIHDLAQKDEFALIILDSCRFDFFQQEADSFLDGKLQKVYSPATATMNYIQTIWDGQYDLTYVTGLPAPTDYAFERKGFDFRPTDHIERFVHVWKNYEGKELGAVPPESMTDAALQVDDDRMVVHYVQPHAPYIGDYKLRKTDDSSTFGDSLQDIYEQIGRYDPSEKTISDDELRKAYRSNLRRVLGSVRELVAQLDRPIIITADHGELLGEGGRYIHGSPQHRYLCELPWFTVDDETIGTEGSPELKATDPVESDEFTGSDVEEQLRDLGYM